MIPDNPVRRDLSQDKRLGHAGGFVVVLAPVVAAHEEKADFSRVKEFCRRVHAPGEVEIRASFRDGGGAS